MIFLAHIPTAMTENLPSSHLLGLTIQLLGLVLFIVSIAFAYKYCKNATCSVRSKGKQVRKIEILETKPLGNRQFLLVVAYEHEKFLLGAHPNGLQFLSKLADDCNNAEGMVKTNHR